MAFRGAWMVSEGVAAYVGFCVCENQLCMMGMRRLIKRLRGRSAGPKVFVDNKTKYSLVPIADRRVEFGGENSEHQVCEARGGNADGSP
jgi:hypothetical protein